MVPTILGLLLTLVAILWFRLRVVEGFAFPVPGHQAFVEESQRKLNSLTNMVNLTDPVVPVQAVTAKDMYQATHGILSVPTDGAYGLKPDVKFRVPSQMPSSLQRATQCQTAPKTCAAFDDATFASNCGMSFDREGSGSDGKPHMGGLYMAPDDRAIQTAAANKVRETGAPPYDPYKVYQPSLGVAKPGTFALTKDQCVVVKEKVDCEAKQSFGTPNCTQCFTSQHFARVGSDTPRIPSMLYFQGQGKVRVATADGSIRLDPTRLETNGAVKIAIPAEAEGITFVIEVEADERMPTYLSGYLEGQTGRGAFKMDLNTMIQSDLETQSKPKMSGTKTVNGFRALSFIPGAKKTRMRLSCLVPFSFLNMYEQDAMTCDNGPIITKESSATFLESDPCFGKGNQPGNYKLECLRSRWIAMGGTAEGTGYPSTAEKAMELQRIGGKMLSLDDIMDQLIVKITAAITGKQANGTQMDVLEWNELSMWALGVPIKSPCDGAQKDAGPLSKKCLAYLYENRGSTSHVGSTYTLPAGQVASTKGSKEGFENVTDDASTYSYPNAPLDPQTATGLSLGQGLGGVEAVKTRYDEINRRANDNTKMNAERAMDVKQVYGVDLPAPSAASVPGPVQVYAVGPEESYRFDEAAGVCAKYGGKVATTAQLQEAHNNGADWCFSSWVAEGGAKRVLTTSVSNACGGRQGIIDMQPPSSGKAGVNCYGPKPRPTEVATGVIKPFNKDMWDPPTEPTYITVPSGYLESSGPQPACFSRLSPDDAKKGCDRLGSQCVGFSYSKNGSGEGCYKGNHAAGLNTNGAYMGYVKIPSATNQPVEGRYIRLDYNRVECLNLAQILVFSSEGGPNVITPNTTVTKSSGYQGDAYPSGNFVNQGGATFVHTSCGDVPWIEVDLGSTMRIHKIVIWNRQDCCQGRIQGTVLSVLNTEKEKVYIANPIRTTNQSYTWFPPNGNVLVDKDPIPVPPAQRVYGNNGSTSCEQYCRGVGGGPWNNELPFSWNGAKCVGHAPGIPNCNSGFSFSTSTYCTCEKTGTGWDTRGWRGP